MLRGLLGLSWEYPERILLGASLVSLVLALATFGRLDFSADRTTLFRQSDQEQLRYQRFQEEFGGWDDLIVVLDGDRQQPREAAVLALAEALEANSKVREVRAYLDLDGLHRWGLYYLSSEELRQVRDALSEYQSLLRAIAQDGWYAFLEHLKSFESKPPPQQSSGSSGHRERIAQAWQEAVESRGSAVETPLFPRIELPERFFYRDGARRHLLFLRSDEPLEVERFVEAWCEGTSFAGQVVVTGQTVLAAHEQKESIRDAILSTVLALVLVQLILVRGFGETSRPRLAFVSLLFGLFWSVSWAALAVGTLNIITINFLAITVGLGVDFSIHILARYNEERAKTGAVESMATTLLTSGRENLVGALATALAFFALCLTEFEAVRQLGLITGVGVMLCFASVALLLPPLLFWRERKGEEPFTPTFENERLTHWETSLRRYPRSALTFGGAALVVMACLGLQVRFDYNLLNLQSDSSAAVSYEKRSGFNSLAAFFVVDQNEQVGQLIERLEEQPAVGEVSSLVELIPLDGDEKQPLIREIHTLAQTLPAPEFSAESPDWGRLRELLKGWEPEEPQPAWLTELRDFGPGPVEAVWISMQEHLIEELGALRSRLLAQEAVEPWSSWSRQHPELLRHWSPEGRLALRVTSHSSLWERAHLEEFVAQLNAVRPGGLGPPFLIQNYLEQLRRSYFDAVRYAMLAIVGLLLLHFRAVLPTLIALVPKVCGAVAMFSAMAVFRVDLNPANCMALPLTLGIGLVFGIHAVHRCLEDPTALLVRGSTGRAIALSGLTTVASFGALLIASHPGIFSLGFVMAAGVAANMLGTYLAVPPLVQLFRVRLASGKS